MSRSLKLNDNTINVIIEELKKKLEECKQKPIAFKYEFRPDKMVETEPVEIYFTPKAYFKMITYVMTFSSEIAWSGSAEKLDHKKYRINDVFVYPQVVSAAAVNVDETKIARWTDEMDIKTENAFSNTKRFHGHSHVNMGVTPSSVDHDTRDDIVKKLKDNDFYIFTIMNKNHDMSFEVYDTTDCKIYDTEDCVAYIEGLDVSMEDIVKEAQSMISKPTATATTQACAAGSNIKYLYQNGYQYSQQTTQESRRGKYPTHLMDEYDDFPYGAFYD